MPGPPGAAPASIRIILIFVRLTVLWQHGLFLDSKG
jgi:hypothetical protein